MKASAVYITACRASSCQPCNSPPRRLNARPLNAAATPIARQGRRASRPCRRCDQVPPKVVGTIATVLVARASCGGRPINISIGANTNPPPMPSRPDSTPATTPISSRGRSGSRSISMVMPCRPASGTCIFPDARPARPLALDPPAHLQR